MLHASYLGSTSDAHHPVYPTDRRPPTASNDTTLDERDRSDRQVYRGALIAAHIELIRITYATLFHKMEIRQAAV